MEKRKIGTHECIIGLLHQIEYSELVTLSELEDHITDNIMHNVLIKRDPLLKECKELYRRELSLKDYADRRKSTNLTRFDYCPECGKAIDWGAMRRKEA